MTELDQMLTIPHQQQEQSDFIFGVTGEGGIGHAIRKIRQERGMTQARLAYLCGISRTQISRTESGWGNPRFSTISAILEALDCSFAIEKHHSPRRTLNKHLKNYQQGTV